MCFGNVCILKNTNTFINHKLGNKKNCKPLIKSLDMKYTVLSLLLVFASITAFSQETDFEKQFQERIKKEIINGVYIPQDLAECFQELNKKISEESKRKFKAMPEADAATKLHFSLGRWIWYNWSLYEGSRLSVYLNKVGVHHPEDMARLVIISYHRYLNKKPLEVKALAEEIDAARKKAKNK